MLYQEPVRSLLLWIAVAGGFEPCWTERILQEARENLLAACAVSSGQWEHLHSALLAAFPDAMIDQGAADAIEHQMPNHPKDRHVLAAAVVGGIDLIVTNNLRHFEQTEIQGVGVRALTADQFLCELLDGAPSVVLGAIENYVARMHNPRQWTIPELLGRLAGLGRGDPLALQFAATASAKLGIGMAPPPHRPKHGGGDVIAP